MKKLGQGVAVAVTLFLLFLYVSPSMRSLNRLPDTVSEWTLGDSTLLSVRKGAAQVRGSGDERLTAGYTVSLFGIVPLRTVAIASGERAVCPGGDAIGIELDTQGVSVVGFGSVLTADGQKNPASDAGLREGDTILSVNGVLVEDSVHFSSLIGGETVTLTVLRDGKTHPVHIVPAIERDTGAGRIGAWVRDSTSGIGTLSVTDPLTGRYAALGHAVTDVDTGAVFPVAWGTLTAARVTGVRRGTEGEPGELTGSFGRDTARCIGNIEQNTVFGIAGSVYAEALLSRPTVSVAGTDEVVKGDAVLYTTIDETGVQTFSCRVIRLEVQASPMTQGMMIEVTDARLLEKTGGIVQGMSGSPIVQNGKLIGVVTHVFVGDPTRGFCLYAEWMAEKLL